MVEPDVRCRIVLPSHYPTITLVATTIRALLRSTMSISLIKPARPFDVIISDCTDPIGPAKAFSLRHFMKANVA